MGEGGGSVKISSNLSAPLLFLKKEYYYDMDRGGVWVKARAWTPSANKTWIPPVMKVICIFDSFPDTLRIPLASMSKVT